MNRPCPQCGTVNRVPARHLSRTGKCGACKAALPPVAQPLDVGPQEFEEITGGATVPVLVDFWAAWCGPCRMAAPHVHRTAETMAGRALVLKVDTEAHPQLAARFGVQSIPNFVVIKGGRTVLQQPGALDARQLQQLLAQAAG